MMVSKNSQKSLRDSSPSLRTLEREPCCERLLAADPFALMGNHDATLCDESCQLMMGVMVMGSKSVRRVART